MQFLLSALAGIAIAIGAALLARRRAGGDAAVRILGREQVLAIGFNVALFAGMILGIAANYFWVHGVEGPVDLNRLWRPVLISPIIFMPVYVAATKQPRGLIPLLIAFQNGFFWQTIFERAGPVGG